METLIVIAFVVGTILAVLAAMCAVGITAYIIMTTPMVPTFKSDENR